jgi:protoheme IX farnesyltransferase
LLLIRPRLSAMVALSALAGYALHPAPGGNPLLLLAGIFLLAAGCTALNQVQERDLDARMERTRRRPLPSGCLRPSVALLIAFSLLGGGLAPLAMAGLLPLLLGLAAAILYNGIYTPLKPRSALALFPGALCGALPPLIGWTAGGGSPVDFRAVLLAGILFLWQVPHFWLHAERHREDYLRAGLPVPAALFGVAQLRRIFFAWTASLAAAVLLVPAFGLIHQPLPRAATVAVCLWLLALAGRDASLAPAPLFRRLTGGMAVLLAIVLLDGLMV